VGNCPLIKLQLQRPATWAGMPHNVGGGPTPCLLPAELFLECRARVGRTIDIARDPVDRPCDVPYYVTGSEAVAGRSGWRPGCWKSSMQCRNAGEARVE